MNTQLDYNEQRLFDALIQKFPMMIEKKQILWIVPIYNGFPNIIKKIQENYEVEFIYDDETGSEVWFLKPLRKK